MTWEAKVQSLPEQARRVGARGLQGQRAQVVSLVLDDPIVGGAPELGMRLVVAVPIWRASGRKEIILPFHPGYMAVDKEEIIAVGVRWFRFSYFGVERRRK